MTRPRLFLLSPRVVFAARLVLLDPAEYPISFVAYDTVTTGAYTDIKPGMTILLGQSAGGDDLGRQRVRGPTTPATAISIFVGRSSRGTNDGELTVWDDAYITVLDDRRVWMKAPFIDADGAIFVDSDLEVEWRTTTPPPVAIMGQAMGGTIDPDTGVLPVAFNGQNSYATADGATIVSWAWGIDDGTLTGGSLATDDNITAEFPPGYRYVSLTVTDSNGKSSATERLVVADDPDDPITFDAFAIDSEEYSDAGVRMTLRILENMSRATYPDGTPCMIWGREPVDGGDRSHMSIVGWLDSEEATHNASRTGLLRGTTIAILDVAGKLDALPGLAQAIADDETRDTSEDSKTPEITWNYMIAPTMDKYMHFLWAWFSTALEVADFIWSGTGDGYQIAIKTSDGESLWNQVSRVAQQMCPGYVLTCDQAGAIRVVPDPQLQELADRTSTVQATITEDDWSDLRFTRQRAPRTHWLRAGALVVQSGISFNADGTIFLPTVFSIAPGDTPGQGLGEVDYNEQLAASQAVLNSATGHKYARMNSSLGLITVTLIQDDYDASPLIPWREIEPALKEWVVVEVTAETAAQRGWPFASIRCLPKEVNVRRNLTRTGETRTIEVTLEPESSGQPGATVVKPVIPGVGDQPSTIPDPIPPPDSGLITGQEVVAGIGKFGRYLTFDFQTPSGSGGPTYVFDNLTGADEMLTWVVDPFSPGYAPGATSGAVNGWAATATALYRLTDICSVSPGATAVITFANTALWRTIQASFGAYFFAGLNPWLMCISYYGSTGGHTGTWATYSKDGGATWSAEVLVSSFYDSGGAINPVALFTSPRTPGFALTAAHIATANPGVTHGFVTQDWGATWTEMTATEDPIELMPGFGNWDDIGGGVYTYLGPGTRESVTAIATSTGAVDIDYEYLVIHPPADCVRMKVTVNWTNEATRSGGFGSQGSSLTIVNGTNVSHTGASNYTQAVVNGGPLSGSFDLEFTFSGTDWPQNREAVEAVPPVALGGTYFYIHPSADAQAGQTRVTTQTITAIVTEIELDGSIIYTPTEPGIILPIHGSAGEIHIPWPSNDDEGVIFYGSLNRSGSPVIGLQRVDAGVVTDISKTVYGVNHGAFSIRSHDSDRSHVLLAGESGAGSRGVWISSDGGDTWTAVVAPSAVAPYQAAFGGDDPAVLYICGPAAYFGYSSNGGSSVDSRAGNLAALSATTLIGLAGGPTP